ncbi:vegetative incompatibility protein HET-E-1 [Paraphaeosphaeria sporulosa]|uniref:Mitochondrial division protein 1 n=1 Tax=Paraphaeosphaeria sporulosa TaxID=1460663 RepID=A0A177CL86_9PLEO|nr:vegetative incompatibility protein HET-E-1 [Paraphaeosphaeria sporulosa]OAG07547.1 vegetative incompatibility protein HET-E-1 [Paraphaeosphaeria sporulosa]
MRLLRRSDTGEFSLSQFRDEAIPPYAILSHTWGPDTEEVTFEDLTNGTGKDKPSYEKIRFCGERAALDDLEYFWIDTCCINKANKAELSQAINSMFRWYGNATRCYVYLSDISSSPLSNTEEPKSPWPWESDFRKCRWFTRGWTLQELLAPSSVEFFSQEGERLGDRNSLRRLIHEITVVPESALEGAPLSQFSVNERLSWIEHRQTKLEEDRAYSLLGIFGVYVAAIYGEGTASAFQRLREEIGKLEQCMQDLHLTDPRDDKKRIEDTKGGLLEASYRWILENSDFQRWRDDEQSRLLWIKGDPGKGKTMLLCGIINELEKSIAKTDLLSYFFCQATDSRINNATAVLRGLLYQLVNQQPSLISHIRKKYDHAGKALFEDANAWVALSDFFTNMIRDPDLELACLVVDALDECVVDLPKLLDLVIHTSASSARVKWLVSSRNEMHIEQKLRCVDAKARLSLELKQNAEQVSRAIDVYIVDKLSRLDSLEDDSLRDRVRDILRRKANGTFLWVALVVQELEGPESWDPLQVVEEAPPGLHQLYDRMMNLIQQLKERNSEICRLLLSTACVTYRPLYLAEMGSLCGLSGQVSVLARNVRTIAAMCGSFLTVRDDQVYLIHQSAKDYLSDKMRDTVFPSQGRIHHNMFFRSLKLMSSALKRDMYGLIALGFPIDKVQVPVHDPLATMRYSCVHWVDHLCDWNSSSANHGIDSQGKDAIENFIRKKYLYWVEALSLCRSMSEGVLIMTKLEGLIQRRSDGLALLELVRDARRFIMYHKQAIQISPLQTYASALVFSPASSLIRRYFETEEPGWITIKPNIGDKWSACLQTLESHSDTVYSVAFSHETTILASASADSTVRIWDTSSGTCLQTLDGHSDWVNSVAFSHDSARVASASADSTVRIWDASSGACLQTLDGHSDWVNSVAFSHDSARVASASADSTVRIWDASSGKCLQTLEGHSDSVNSTLRGHIRSVTAVAWSPDSTRLASASFDTTTLEGHSDTVYSVAFSHDSTMLASASDDSTIRIWDASSDACVRTPESHSGIVTQVTFSHDSARLASASYDKTIRIWDASSGKCLQTLGGHSQLVFSVAFSHDSTRLASASVDSTARIWDASSGACLQTLKDHSDSVLSATFSHDSTRLASASLDRTIRIWDTSSGACMQTLDGHSDSVNSVAFSHDSARVASASSDKTVKIWDASSGECLQTLEGHSDSVDSVAFSHDSARVASASTDKTVKIWDASSGKCLQTLNIGKALHNISFDATASYLHTAIGTVTVDAPSDSNIISDKIESSDPQYQGVGLNSNGDWITYNSKNLVWLPSEHRPRCSAVSERTIGIGIGSGKVWVCKVELDAS